MIAVLDVRVKRLVPTFIPILRRFDTDSVVAWIAAPLDGNRRWQIAAIDIMPGVFEEHFELLNVLADLVCRDASTPIRCRTLPAEIVAAARRRQEGAR